MINKLKNNKGITLIALVITIIVLLILAGVAISMLAGDNGILRQAASAKEVTSTESIKEQINLAYLSSVTSGLGEVDYDTLNVELHKIGYEGDNITSLPAHITINGENYTIDKNGKASDIYVWTGEIDTTWYNNTDITFDISTPEQLAGLAYLVNMDKNDFTGKTINLTNDIWLNSKDNMTNEWLSIGGDGTYKTTWYTSTPFQGCFDGKQHVINGLKQDAWMLDADISSADFLGLFGHIGTNGIVKNVGIDQSIINAGGATNPASIASYNEGKIQDCWSNATIEIDYTGNVCGGIVSDNDGGNIGKCYFTGKLVVGNSAGNSEIGGVVGWNGGSVKNCYSIGEMIRASTTTIIGGVIGSNYLEEDAKTTIIAEHSYYYTGNKTGTVGAIDGQDDTANDVVGKDTIEETKKAIK